MGARLYDGSSGRFVSQDVLSGTFTAPGSDNDYGYAEGDPIRNTDPTGMSCPHITGPNEQCPGQHVPPRSQPTPNTRPGPCSGSDCYVPAPPPPNVGEATPEGTDSGCGFLGYHCIARAGGAVGSFVASHATVIKQSVLVVAAVGCVAATAGMWGWIAAGAFLANEAVIGDQLLTHNITGTQARRRPG
jgi:hypothetical protein